jgi:membrane protease YdiL (CAAX protease family)
MRVYRTTELLGLFVLIPILFYFDFIPGPKAIPLLAAFLFALVYLIRSKTFNRKELGFNGYSKWGQLTLRMTIAAIVVYLLTIVFVPEQLFYLPKNNPKLWIAIMIFYPIWSAFTQELIYRPFFFHRYKTLFFNDKILLVLNGLLFGFLHIIFKNWVAVLGSTIIGLYWAYPYSKHKSQMVVFIEHSFVGNMLYTFGLGSYFYVPDF